MELFLDLLEIVLGHFDFAAVMPGAIKGKKMDVSVGNVGADDFPESALAELLFHVLAELLDGGHEGLVIGVGEVVDFVDF